jgi:4-amino-4-deoxy-L-arabinose transferase-like glycosyltransferase
MGRVPIQLRDVIDPILFVAFFLLAVLLVPPRGEFPINDDWDYHATVADLLHHGEMRLSDWPAMPLVGQIYWGAGFAKLFGLSYQTLRFSVLCFALLGALALYYWARAIERSREESLFLGLLFAASPLVFTLSYSFMTDVPGTSLMLLGLLAQAHWARRGGVPLALLAGVTAGLGYLVRQTAALPALVLAASLLLAVLRRRARAAELFGLIAPLALAIVAHGYWLDHVHGRPYQAAVERMGLLKLLLIPEYRVRVIQTILRRLVQHLVAVGIYLSPLLLCLVGSRVGRELLRSRLTRIVVALTFLGLFVPHVSGMRIAPLSGLYANGLYLGFETVYPGSALRGPSLRIGPLLVTVRSVLTVVGIASLALAAGLSSVALRGWWRDLRRGERWLPLSPGGQAGVCGFLLLGVLVVQSLDFDRYLVPILPLLAMLVLSRMPRGRGVLRSPLCWGLLGVLAAFSFVGTQDYFTRARARWQAREYLLQSGIEPAAIAAGFEHAALYCFAPRYRQPTRVRPYLLGLPPNQREMHLRVEDPSIVWIQPRPYEVGYAVAPGAQVVAAFPYRSWFRSGSVFAFRHPR